MPEADLCEVELVEGIEYLRRADGPLAADLYRPAGASAVPALVAVHGGGWRLGDRRYYRYFGHYLAARGIAMFSVSYRLATGGTNLYPAAVHDVRGAVQFLRRNGNGLGIDPDRLGLFGSSAGGHLAALVALAGDLAPFAGAPDDVAPGTSCAVKVAVPVYGCYDLVAQWRHDLLRGDNLPEGFLGVSPTVDRRIYHEASPLTYATVHANKTSFLLVWSTGDDRVDYATQSVPLLEALKQARYYVRTVIIPDAPHYWMADPIDEPGSHSGYLAPRLYRFLAERL